MGGYLMRWMDIAAANTPGKHCEAHVVTAAVDHISFKSRSGREVITMDARVTRAFNSSVEIYVKVFANDIKGQTPGAAITPISLSLPWTMPAKYRLRYRRCFLCPVKNKTCMKAWPIAGKCASFFRPDQSKGRDGSTEVFCGYMS